MCIHVFVQRCVYKLGLPEQISQFSCSILSCIMYVYENVLFLNILELSHDAGK